MNPYTKAYLIAGFICVLIHWFYFEPQFTKKRDKGYMTKQVMITIFAFICPLGYAVASVITLHELAEIKKRENK